jgi:hypothetical protein
MDTTPTAAEQREESARIKKPYRAPHLIRHGTVEDLTGGGGPGTPDMVSGTAAPPR